MCVVHDTMSVEKIISSPFKNLHLGAKGARTGPDYFYNLSNKYENSKERLIQRVYIEKHFKT